MSEMIQRVAEALCRVAGDAPSSWREYVEDARAAIEAMRMPTDAQIAAFEGLCDLGGDLRQSGHDDLNRNGDSAGYIRNAYTAMIDAALAATS